MTIPRRLTPKPLRSSPQGIVLHLPRMPPRSRPTRPLRPPPHPWPLRLRQRVATAAAPAAPAPAVMRILSRMKLQAAWRLTIRAQLLQRKSWIRSRKRTRETKEGRSEVWGMEKGWDLINAHLAFYFIHFGSWHSVFWGGSHSNFIFCNVIIGRW